MHEFEKVSGSGSRACVILRSLRLWQQGMRVCTYMCAFDRRGGPGECAEWRSGARRRGRAEAVCLLACGSGGGGTSGRVGGGRGAGAAAGGRAGGAAGADPEGWGWGGGQAAGRKVRDKDEGISHQGPQPSSLTTYRAARKQRQESAG